MHVALTTGGLLLAVLLAVAAAGKLRDLEGSRSAVGEFGVPSAFARPLSIGLPVLELLTAALLVAGAASLLSIRVGAWSALVLLTAFTVAIAVNLLLGRRPDCHCFGKLHSSPVGPWTLARNGVLLAVASFVASGGGAIPAAIAGGATLALLVVVALRDRHESEASRPEGLPVGSPAPEFAWYDVDGRRSLASLRALGRPILLVFTDPHCGPCVALAPSLSDWKRDHAAQLTLLVLEGEAEIADLYGAHGTPTAVLIGRDGSVASRVAAGAAQIESLVRTSVAARRRLRPLRRRELLVRATGAGAVVGVTLARPAHAASALVARVRGEPCEDVFDCPSPRGMECRNRRCVCEEGQTRCDPEEATDRKCFDLQTHKDHCGRCNHQCTGADFNDVCCEGRCGQFGRTRCNCAGEPCPGEHDVCTAPSDAPNDFFCFPCADFGWKRCGNECADPETKRCCGDRIYDKARLGPGDWRCCGPAGARRLVNVREHERNCGDCGRRCRPGQFCFGGRCRDKCPRGRTRCGDTCISTRTHRCCEGRVISTTDPKHCGGCGRTCTGPFDTGECCLGECCDINGSTCCPDGCKNLAHDENNCGACGTVCGPNSYCRFGVCTCPSEPCP